MASRLVQSASLLTVLACLFCFPIHPAAAQAERCGNDCNPLAARQVQSQLRYLGLYSGRIDGRCGQATRAALRKFQAGQGKRGDGCIDGNALLLLQQAAQTKQDRADKASEDRRRQGGKTAFNELRVRDAGNQYRISSLAPGKRILLLHFWATFCPECIHELPSLQRFMKSSSYRGYQQRDVAIIPISEDFDVSTVNAFMRRHKKRIGGAFRILLDTDNKVIRTLLQSRDYQLPQTIAVDRATGRVLATLPRSIDWMDGSQVDPFMRQALSQGGSKAVKAREAGN